MNSKIVHFVHIGARQLCFALRLTLTHLECWQSVCIYNLNNNYLQI